MSILSRLEKVASSLEDLGLTQTAAAIDAVSNTISVPLSKVLDTVGWDGLVRTVVFNGGTHGDEMTGIVLIKELSENHALVTRPGIDLKLQIGNPEAVAKNVHYLDYDLNECFDMDDLITEGHTGVEKKRAQEIFRDLGGRKGATDLVVDFHNTTANMGYTIILERLDPFICRLAATLYTKYKDVGAHILYTPEVRDDSTSLDSLGRSGMTLEVGPLKHGLYLDAKQYTVVRSIAVDIMDFVSNWDAGNIDRKSALEVPVYRHVQDIKYLVDPSGHHRFSDVHPGIMGKDYQPITKGTPIMVDLSTGQPVLYEGEETVWPVFIDETSPTYAEPWKDDEALELTWLSTEKW